MTTIQDVRDALAELGGDAEEIAQSLRKKKIVGAAKRCNECPISIFLEREFGGSWMVSLAIKKVVPSTDNQVSGYDPFPIDGYRVSDGLWFRTPDPVYDFMLRFDRGDFPNLHAPRTIFGNTVVSQVTATINYNDLY